MKNIKIFILSLFIALPLAFAFNFYFLDLSTRPLIDQILLMFFLSTSLFYIIFSIIGKEKSIITGKEITSTNYTFSFSENKPGIFLALIFIVIYLYFGLRINSFGSILIDNLFDSDSPTWTRRISAPDMVNFEMRGPHPFAYLIFRPFGWILNLITKDPPLSSLLLNTITGGLCVLLAWAFIRQQFQSRLYASLIAALLGLSSSHLFFGSVIETYIFSAFSLILFFTVLQANQRSVALMIVASVLTFGITFTNFAQNIIGFFVSRPRWREVLRYMAWTISISMILSFIHAAWYPASKLFFLLSGAQNEEKFFIEILQLPKWRIIGRFVLLVRTIFLYSVIAPIVFVLREEVGSYYPEFSFFKLTPGTISQSSYDGLGSILVLIWIIMLAIAGSRFLWNLVHTRKADLSLAFALCVLFNFVLHINYGQEPFLYSPDWAYALIFFVAYGLAPLRENRFFQAGFLIFLLLLAYNQFQFIEMILHELAPYTGGAS